MTVCKWRLNTPMQSKHFESGSIQIGSLASNGSNTAGPVNSVNTSGGVFI